jgi:hypothetical protein
MGALEIAAFLTWLATNRRVSTTMVYTHVFIVVRSGVRSPVDRLDVCERGWPRTVASNQGPMAVRIDARNLDPQEVWSLQRADPMSVVGGERSRPMRLFLPITCVIAVVRAR